MEKNWKKNPNLILANSFVSMRPVPKGKKRFSDVFKYSFEVEFYLIFEFAIKKRGKKKILFTFLFTIKFQKENQEKLQKTDSQYN